MTVVVAVLLLGVVVLVAAVALRELRVLFLIGGDVDDSSSVVAGASAGVAVGITASTAAGGGVFEVDGPAATGSAWNIKIEQ